MQRLQFPSSNFVSECKSAIARDEHVEIVVPRSSGKTKSVRYIVDNLNGKTRGGVVFLFHVWRAYDFFLATSRAATKDDDPQVNKRKTQTDWKFDYTLADDLVVHLSPR
jgi:hypothetical protein